MEALPFRTVANQYGVPLGVVDMEGAMTAKAILRQTMSEKQYKKLPTRIRHIIKVIDALPPTPKPVTVKQFAELFR
jgi:hypothetical protein